MTIGRKLEICSTTWLPHATAAAAFLRARNDKSRGAAIQICDTIIFTERAAERAASSKQHKEQLQRERAGERAEQQ